MSTMSYGKSVLKVTCNQPYVRWGYRHIDSLDYGTASQGIMLPTLDMMLHQVKYRNKIYQLHLQEVPISSATTVASVASYSENEYSLVETMFHNYETQFGFEKSFPVAVSTILSNMISWYMVMLHLKHD